MVDTPEERWDQNLADWLIGKYVLVGVTYHNSDGTRLVQLHGIVKSADKTSNIVIECLGSRKGEQFRLPPNTAVFGPGQKGIYKLRTTDEEVDSPDAVATWEISQRNAIVEE